MRKHPSLSWVTRSAYFSIHVYAVVAVSVAVTDAVNVAMKIATVAVLQKRKWGIQLLVSGVAAIGEYTVHDHSNRAKLHCRLRKPFRMNKRSGHTNNNRNKYYLIIRTYFSSSNMLKFHLLGKKYISYFRTDDLTLQMTHIHWNRLKTKTIHNKANVDATPKQLDVHYVRLSSLCLYKWTVLNTKLCKITVSEELTASSPCGVV